MADLLKSSQPGLCLSCHNGLGATANVVGGVQYTPTGNSTYQQTTVLGALRGGGFSYALLNAAAPDRLSYNSRGGTLLKFDAAPGAGTSVTLRWAAFGPFGGGDLTFDPSGSAPTSAVNTLFGTSAAYSGSTTSFMSGLPAGDANMTVSKATDSTTGVVTFTFATQNALRLYPVPLPSVFADNTGQNATTSDGISIGQTSRVPVLASGQAVTSTHLGLGTVWGNGAQGIGTPGATGVDLECTSCHNPHGNGMYRILQAKPGEDWANDTVEATTTLATDLTTATTPITVTSTAGFPDASGAETAAKYYILVDSEKMYVTAGFGTTTLTVTRGALGTTAASHLAGATVKFITTGWTDPATDVEVIDGPPLTAGQVHNYTVKAGYLASQVAADPQGGDYWRYKWDFNGTTNFTNFYLLKDPMNSGWDGQTPTNEAAIAAIPDTTLSAALSATATSATVPSTAAMPRHTPAAEPQPTWLVKIDSEILSVSVATTGTPPSGFSGTSLKVSRGQYGTTAAAHLINAPVTVIRSDSVDPQAYLYNNTGRMTAFCIQCHTRYNGWRQNGTSSLNAQTPMDALFTYKHGTTNTGCEQCHVNHGTNAVMSGIAATVLFPDGTSEDSALLKVNNRGTCQLCHDPTGTIPAGNVEGTVPVSLTPQ